MESSQQWWWPLFLATAAGLSTSIGAVVSVIQKPTHQTMAFLLGVALGVMATVSIVELLVKNALESDGFLVCASGLSGAVAYYLLEPLFPRFGEENFEKKPQGLGFDVARDADRSVTRKHIDTGGSLSRKANQGHGGFGDTGHAEDNLADVIADPRDYHHGMLEASTERANKLSAAKMLRLGVLMAITMTLHNLPEGFAVAFSAFTDFGPIMALAIALHNIPEGIIVAAPIYAATGSRWKAVGLATASGLSEPLGAMIALLLLRSVFSMERLHYLLAFVGGVMLAVCGIELWPEGRNCRHDRHFLVGIGAGAAVMGWTLYVQG